MLRINLADWHRWDPKDYSLPPIKIGTLSFSVRPIKIAHSHLWKVLPNSLLIYINLFTTYITSPPSNTNNNVGPLSTNTILTTLLLLSLTLSIMH